MKRFALVGAVALVAVAALVWSQWRAGPLFVSGFIEAEQIRVGSRIGGRVQSVHVEEGASVDQGVLLIQLEPFDLQERLAEAQATLAAREAQLAELRAGPRAEEIAQARAMRDRVAAELERLTAGARPLEIQIREDALALANARQTYAEAEYARIRRLFEANQASEEEMQIATRNRDTARAEAARAAHELELIREGARTEEIAAARAQLAEAEQKLALLEAGTRAEQIEQAKAQAAAAAAAVAAVRQQIEELAVTAPVDAIVEAVDLEPGDLIAPNAPVISLLDPTELWVRAYVPEDELDLQLDQRVTLRVDAFPDRRFAGRIIFISRQGEFTPSNIQTPEERSQQVFRIKVRIEEGRDVLRAGMAADVFLEPPP